MMVADRMRIMMRLTEIVDHNHDELNDFLNRIKAMRHLGTIAAEVPAATTTIYACLLEFLRTNDALLQGKAFRVLADIVRMYPLVIEEALSFLSSCIRNCCSEEYRSVCIWMAGEVKKLLRLV